MEAVKEQLMDRLVSAVAELPTDKMVEVLDFVGYLQSQYNQRNPPRGSAEAFWKALETNHLLFDPGELDELLADIEQMRELDIVELEEHGTYLLDTNHASRLMSKVEPFSSRMHQAQLNGDDVGLSVTVLSELYFAVYASRRQADNMRNLRMLLGYLPVWPFDELAADMFGRIQAEQKAKGFQIPPLDAQIAAVARARGITLLTEDRPFQFINGLAIQNWLA